jgi:hypothetical protein
MKAPAMTCAKDVLSNEDLVLHYNTLCPNKSLILGTLFILFHANLFNYVLQCEVLFFAVISY